MTAALADPHLVPAEPTAVDPRVGRRATAEELLSMPDSGTLELHDGIITEKNVGAESSEIGLNASFRLRTAAAAEGVRAAFGAADGGFQCFAGRPNLVKKPDVSVILRDRLPGGVMPKGWLTIPADLAVEVISPNDLFDEVSQKVRLYLDNGFRMVWVLDPGGRCAFVYTPDSVRAYRDGETIDADPVLPGLRVAVADLFDVGG